MEPLVSDFPVVAINDLDKMGLGEPGGGGAHP